MTIVQMIFPVLFSSFSMTYAFSVIHPVNFFLLRHPRNKLCLCTGSIEALQTEMVAYERLFFKVFAEDTTAQILVDDVANRAPWNELLCPVVTQYSDFQTRIESCNLTCSCVGRSGRPGLCTAGDM